MGEPGSGRRSALAVIGAGRAGSALAIAFDAAGYTVTAVHSRTPAHAERLARATGAAVCASAVEATARADITLATVPDGEVGHVAEAVAKGAGLAGHALVHCSATHGREVLVAAEQAGLFTGAFHPLQTLAGASSAPLLRGSSFAIEAAGELRSRLGAMAADLGGRVIEVAPGGRALYHAAAVLVGNAPLALLARATSLLEEAGVPHDDAHAALVALTGPVVRGDAATVRRHLDVLEDDPATRELYRRLALETLALAGPEGREAVAEVLAEPPAPAAPVVAHPRVA